MVGVLGFGGFGCWFWVGFGLVGFCVGFVCSLGLGGWLRFGFWVMQFVGCFGGLGL